MTKTDKVKKILKEQGYITSWEAIQRVKATRLSAIIYNLRDYGWEIDTEMKPGPDGNHYSEYILIRSGGDNRGKQENVQHQDC